MMGGYHYFRKHPCGIGEPFFLGMIQEMLLEQHVFSVEIESLGVYLFGRLKDPGFFFMGLKYCRCLDITRFCKFKPLKSQERTSNSNKDTSSCKQFISVWELHSSKICKLYFIYIWMDTSHFVYTVYIYIYI